MGNGVFVGMSEIPDKIGGFATHSLFLATVLGGWLAPGVAAMLLFAGGDLWTLLAGGLLAPAPFVACHAWQAALIGGPRAKDGTPRPPHVYIVSGIATFAVVAWPSLAAAYFAENYAVASGMKILTRDTLIILNALWAVVWVSKTTKAGKERIRRLVIVGAVVIACVLMWLAHFVARHGTAGVDKVIL